MTEKDFEKFCRMRFNNPDFLLGRKRKKDTTDQSENHLIGEESKDDILDTINDIA